MAKEKGRKPIDIIDSVPYSTILFLIASGVNYTQAISEARRIDTSATFKQIEILRKKGFLNKPTKEALLNKTIYSINWDKITDEFFRLIKEHKKEFLETHEQVKTNLAIEKLNELKRLDDNAFIVDLKKNKYLRYAFREYFSQISKLKRVTLSSAFIYFVFFGNFDFIYSTHPSLWGFINWRETKAQLEEKDRHKKKEFKSNEEVRKEANKIMADLEENMKKQDNMINNLVLKNKDLTNFLLFNKIMKILSSDLALQLALNEATELTAFSIVKENFPEDEIKEYQEQLFFPRSLRYKGVPDEIISNVQEKIKQGFEERTKENASDDEKTKEFKKLIRLGEKNKEKDTSHSNPSLEKGKETK